MPKTTEQANDQGKPGMASIVVPTYKENDNIRPLVERLQQNLKTTPYEIIFVDDNSRDGTEATVAGLAAEFPVRLIVRKDKRGLSSAVVDGIKASAGELVVVMDADLQHPPEVVPDLLRALKDYEVVVGSRYCRGGSPGEFSASRKVVSAVANLMALPLAWKVKDRMSGFFGFRRRCVRPEELNPQGWKIGLEVLVCGHYRKVTEVPYTFAPRRQGASKLSGNVMWQYIRELFSLYLKKYQISNFMLVGGIGYIVNMAAYALMTYNIHADETVFLGQHFYLLPFVASSLLAIICNYILNKIWTFKGWAEARLGGLRYLLMALATLVLDLFFLGLLVDKGGMSPVPAAAVAILIVFVVRFAIARKWIWTKK